MIVTAYIIELRLYGCFSLKDKRRILQSLLTRLKQKYNISIAELFWQDKIDRAEIGLAIVSQTERFGQQQMQAVVNFIDATDSVEIIQLIPY